MEEKPAGPDQENVGLFAFVATWSVTVPLVHVSCPPVAVAVGGWILLVAVVEADCVQPLVVLVTTSVYVPAAFTKGFNVVAPETMLPPLDAVQR